MPAKIVVPELGESVLEATVGHWLKKEGDRVNAGEALVALETDKVDLEVGAERSGVLAKIERQEGEDVKIGDVLGVIEDAPAAEKSAASESAPPNKEAQTTSPPPEPDSRGRAESGARSQGTSEVAATPSARRLAREQGVALSEVANPEGGRVTKEAVEKHLKGGATAAAPTEPAPSPEASESAAAPGTAPPLRSSPAALPEAPAAGGPAPPKGSGPSAPLAKPLAGERREERIRMSRRRQTIARRLVEAQHSAAMLTTFNEVDMSAVMELRKRHKKSFEERYGVALGLSSFFVKASVAALHLFPGLNAEIDGDTIVLKHFYDIGIAVGASDGLVVPVLRDANLLSFAEIETGIKDLARKAKERTLALDDLRGGTFTITNGGVFGSLMSTPILNPPQVAILGLHKVQERPVTLDGAIVSRPMMYVALSYDHRCVDGLEAVQFLVRVKQLVEEPASLLLEG